MADTKAKPVEEYSGTVNKDGRWTTAALTDSGTGGRITIDVETPSDDDTPLHSRLVMPLDPAEIFDLKRTVDALAAKYPYEAH